MSDHDPNKTAGIYDTLFIRDEKTYVLSCDAQASILGTIRVSQKKDTSFPATHTDKKQKICRNLTSARSITYSVYDAASERTQAKTSIRHGPLSLESSDVLISKNMAAVGHKKSDAEKILREQRVTFHHMSATKMYLNEEYGVVKTVSVRNSKTVFEVQVESIEMRGVAHKKGHTDMNGNILCQAHQIFINHI
jgi:hypothetical protein